MKTTNLFKELLIAALAIVPLVYFMFIWSSLPATIPIHFDARGNPNNYGSKVYMALTLFFMNIGIYFFIKYLPKIDPKRNFDVFGKTFYKLRFILSLFFATISFIIIFSAIYKKVPVSLLYIIFAFLISIFGNYMNNIKPNYFLGVRSPWTLENETIWKKTHNFAGKLWFFSGILLSILMIALPSNIKLIAFISIILLLAIIPILYSYQLFRKMMKINNKN